MMSSRAGAQGALPDKPLRILVGFSAGGGAELMARVLASALERRSGRRCRVENKPNGDDAVAGMYFKKDLEEGLVVAFMPTTALISKPEGSPFPFDAQSRLVPLAVAGTLQAALAVAPESGIKTFKDYVDWLRAGAVERAHVGTTTTDSWLNIYTAMIGRDLGTPLTAVPQKGAAGLVRALLERKVPAGLGSVTPLIQHKRAGDVRVLMTSGRKRLWILRDVPTALELGHPALELADWYGFFASSASPAPVVAEWNRQLQAVLGDREVIAQLGDLGLDVEKSEEADVAARFAALLQSWKGRAESLGLKLDNQVSP